MFKMLGAAVAAVALSFAGQASAAVLLQKSGSVGHEDYFLTADDWYPYLKANGVIEIVVDWTPEPGQYISGFLAYDSHRVYGTGHMETLLNERFGPAGFEELRSFAWSSTATGFVLRLTDIGGYHCEDWQPEQTCFWDTARRLEAVTGPYTVDYNLTVRSVDSAVPEPATWLMLIAGFGLTGAALRRRQAAMSQNTPI